MELDHIDEYFKQILPDEERTAFQNRISSDKKFAADVAYYIGTRQIIKQLLLEQKQADWEGYDLTKVDFASMAELELTNFLEKLRGKNIREFNRFLTDMILVEVRRKKERTTPYRQPLRTK